jgi:hypothetical protein
MLSPLCDSLQSTFSRRDRKSGPSVKRVRILFRQAQVRRTCSSYSKVPLKSGAVQSLANIHRSHRSTRSIGSQHLPLLLDNSLPIENWQVGPSLRRLSHHTPWLSPESRPLCVSETRFRCVVRVIRAFRVSVES